jgi:hypothetical protein
MKKASKTAMAVTTIATVLPIGAELLLREGGRVVRPGLS